MSINKFIAEGYYDPTCYEALSKSVKGRKTGSLWATCLCMFSIHRGCGIQHGASKKIQQICF